MSEMREKPEHRIAEEELAAWCCALWGPRVTMHKMGLPKDLCPIDYSGAKDGRIRFYAELKTCTYLWSWYEDPRHPDRRYTLDLSKMKAGLALLELMRLPVRLVVAFACGSVRGCRFDEACWRDGVIRSPKNDDDKPGALITPGSLREIGRWDGP